MTPEFEKILNWGGTPVATCCCGRVHYCAGGLHMEPGELLDLDLKRQTQPENYIPDHENDCVGITTFNGISHVFGCPCGNLDKLEKFIWSHREIFLAYYRDRTGRELREATANAKAIEGLTKAQ